MKKPVILFLYLLVGLALLSWSGHDAITYFSIKHIMGGLVREVEITGYVYEDLDPGPYNPTVTFDDYLGSTVVPEEDRFIFMPVYDNLPPENGRAPAWQILVVYSVEPDMGMDRELELCSLQGLTGGSQGWRHMDFRLGFLRLGETTNRVDHLTRLSKQAWERSDHYWGLRFMAWSLHYLQDIGQPFHTFPAPVAELLRLPFNFSKWFNTFMNYHYFYDFYLGYRLYREYEPFVSAILEAPAHELKNAFYAAEAQRSFARDRLSDIYYEIRGITSGALEVNYELDFTLAFFDELAASGKTERLDELTIELITEVASYAKGYMAYMLEYVNLIDKE